MMDNQEKGRRAGLPGEAASVRTGPSAKGPEAGAPLPDRPHPRGQRARIVLTALLVGTVMLAVGVRWSGPLSSGFSRLAEALSSSKERAKHDHPSSLKQYYTCGMHPWVVLPSPGDCPICHMKLVPLDPAKFTGEIAINPVVTQDIGVRVAPVAIGAVTRTIRTVGTVDYNETLVRDVNLKVSGWVEKLYADYVGKPIGKGQPLLDIYSPELYSAQEEYLQAYKQSVSPGSSPAAKAEPEAAKWNSDLLESARKRLEYFDVSAEQIRNLDKTGKVSKTLTLASPYDGLVIQKMVYEGMKVDAGMQLYRIADLSNVWVMATLYEFQIPYVLLGQEAEISLPYIPGQKFVGKVTYIYPYLNPSLRQIKVRLEFDNPDLALKPGMFANVELRGTLARDRVLVPREAVIDTGERKVAFVSLGEGKFEPRNVRTGVEADDGRIEILDGLKPGEMVVTSGQFLLDSESRLREALAKMVKGDMAYDRKSGAAQQGASELASLPDASAGILSAVIEEYFRIGALLSSDAMEGLPAGARQLAQNAGALIQIEIPGNPHFWHQHSEIAQIRGKALELAEAKDLEQARVEFADLSAAMSKLLKATGIPPSYGKEVRELHCPMYRQGQGGTYWLQQAGEVRNPYLGKKMLGCFDAQSAIPVTGANPAAGQGAGAARPPAEALPQSSTGPASAPVSLTSHQQQLLDEVATSYLAIQQLLAGDTIAGIGDHLAAASLAASNLSKESSGPMKSAADLIVKAAAGEASTIDAARLSFKGLSTGVIELVRLAAPSAQVAPTLYIIHCPMTKADWLQPTQDISNPYYGKSMPGCGSVVGVIRTATAGQRQP